jgi:hypothetical protein
MNPLFLAIRDTEPVYNLIICHPAYDPRGIYFRVFPNLLRA